MDAKRISDISQLMGDLVTVCAPKPDTRILEANSAWTVVTGWAPQDLIGKRVFDFLHPEDVERTKAESAALDVACPATFANRFRKKDGSYCVLAWKTAVESATRKIVSVARDITFEMKREQGERDRVREVAVQSQKSVLAEVASGIAHELNNPLAIFEATVETIKNQALTANLDLTDLLNHIYVLDRNAKRMTRIIRGLRAFVLASPDGPLESVPLKALIDDTLILVQSRIAASGVAFSLNPMPDVIVPCRPAQVAQALFNLLLNALDAAETSRGQAKWVRLGAIRTGNRIQLRITDSGPGIEEQYQSRLFQPFFTTKPIGKGAGLGLSSAAGLIRAQGGALHFVQGAPNTEFVMELPCESAENGGVAA